MLKREIYTCSKSHQSNFELTSNENVDSMGVIASSAVCIRKHIIRNSNPDIRSDTLDEQQIVLWMAIYLEITESNLEG